MLKVARKFKKQTCLLSILGPMFYDSEDSESTAWVRVVLTLLQCGSGHVDNISPVTAYLILRNSLSEQGPRNRSERGSREHVSLCASLLSDVQARLSDEGELGSLVIESSSGRSETTQPKSVALQMK